MSDDGVPKWAPDWVRSILCAPTVEPEDAFKLLKLSRNTGYRMIRSGEIKAKKYGRQWRVSTQWLRNELGY